MKLFELPRYNVNWHSEAHSTSKSKGKILSPQLQSHTVKTEWLIKAQSGYLNNNCRAVKTKM